MSDRIYNDRAAVLAFKAEANPTEGEYPAHTGLGAYPFVYLTENGEYVCPECVNNDVADVEEDITGYFVYYEGPTEWCIVCSAEIESAYGDPEADEFKCDQCGRIADIEVSVKTEEGYICETCAPWEGYHGPNADDGTQIISEIILGKLDTAPASALVDHKTESAPRKPYMSVDRNFRATIHEGNDNG